jgi:predicted neutral ceramidase superfamily lipid hydrolase
LVFLFGGVDPAMLLWWLALAVVVMLLLGTIGLLMSTLVRSSGAAMALTYLFCLVVFVLLPIFTIVMIFASTGDSPNCVVDAIGALHPIGSLMFILGDDGEGNPGAMLTATLPLYGAVAGLFFMAAEARLSHLTARRWRRPLPVLLLLLITIGTATYIALGPSQAYCRST